jgi:curli biogenesis system outer membrane secretion channel CsgG
MYKIIIPIVFILQFIVISCSTNPYVLVKKDFTGEGIAVLNFSTHGSFPEANLGRIAADKLTNALFLDGSFSVIDRSLVNEAQVKTGIKSSEVLSSEDVLNIGTILNANYLIIGKIHQISEIEFLNTDLEKHLNISFRIVAVANSEVVGMADYTTLYTENVIAVTEEILKELVKSM